MPAALARPLARQIVQTETGATAKGLRGCVICSKGDGELTQPTSTLDPAKLVKNLLVVLREKLRSLDLLSRPEVRRGCGGFIPYRDRLKSVHQVW